MYHQIAGHDHLLGGRELRLSLHAGLARPCAPSRAGRSRGSTTPWGESVTGPFSHPRRPRRAGRLAAAALALAALVSGATAAAAAAAAPAGAGIRVAFCPDAAGPFSVQGTRVVDGSGKTFVSYGI